MSEVLTSLPLARLRFELKTREASDVPPYKGDMLRMALLWWLSEFWCPEPQRCRNGCRRPDVCMFGRLCEPVVDPNWSPQIRRLLGDTPPPAYALWDLQDRRTHFAAGDAWSFELTLTGELVLRQIPAIIAAVQQGAESGMGRIRLRSSVQRVGALVWSAAGTLEEHSLAALETAQPAGVADKPGPLLWQSYRVDGIALGLLQAVQWAERWATPVQTLRIDYLSPVKLKERGDWVETPEFSAVARALTRRLRILSEVYGGGEWPHAEYGPLLDLADNVRLEHHETHWLDYARHSKQSGTYPVEGFVGPAWYTAEDFRPWLPVLWLGQWLHIGKGYVIGSGRYRLQINGNMLTSGGEARG